MQEKMRQAVIKYNNIQAGILRELDSGEYEFVYDKLYIQNHPGLFIVHYLQNAGNVFALQKQETFPFF